MDDEVSQEIIQITLFSNSFNTQIWATWLVFTKKEAVAPKSQGKPDPRHIKLRRLLAMVPLVLSTKPVTLKTVSMWQLRKFIRISDTKTENYKFSRSLDIHFVSK